VNLYTDASGLIKLFLWEPGSAQMAKSTEGSSVACAAIGYVELRAGLARAWRQGRITREIFEAHVASAQQLWTGITSIPVDHSLMEDAAENAERHTLRAYDAVHLAALEAAGPPGTITFACWDRDLRDAAGGLGYDLLPTTL
jgi:uncharacterized protein